VIFVLPQSQRRLKAKEQIGDCHLKVFKVKNHLHAYENRYHLPVQVDFDIGVFVHVSHQPETKEVHSFSLLSHWRKANFLFSSSFFREMGGFLGRSVAE
jgi:hypothetical protein